LVANDLGMLGHYDACFKTVHYLSLSPTDDGRDGLFTCTAEGSIT